MQTEVVINGVKYILDTSNVHHRRLVELCNASKCLGFEAQVGLVLLWSMVAWFVTSLAMGLLTIKGDEEDYSPPLVSVIPPLLLASAMFWGYGAGL